MRSMLSTCLVLPVVVVVETGQQLPVGYSIDSPDSPVLNSRPDFVFIIIFHPASYRVLSVQHCTSSTCSEVSTRGGPCQGPPRAVLFRILGTTCVYIYITSSNLLHTIPDSLTVRRVLHWFYHVSDIRLMTSLVLH